MTKGAQMYEGKAKKVFATDDPTLVIVDYKDCLLYTSERDQGGSGLPCPGGEPPVGGFRSRGGPGGGAVQPALRRTPAGREGGGASLPGDGAAVRAAEGMELRHYQPS